MVIHNEFLGLLHIRLHSVTQAWLSGNQAWIVIQKEPILGLSNSSSVVIEGT
jgi:hypothetical protein